MDRNPDQTARKTAKSAFIRLAADLKAGRNTAFTDHLAAMSRFHRYSWDNVLLIAAQRPEARRVAGIHTWHSVGRAIKPGEKGILIFVPERDKHPSRSQAPPKQEPLEWGAGWRSAYLFDVSQTKGKPLPECARPTVDAKRYEEQLKTLIAEPSVSEIQAQAVAYVVARGLGIENQTAAADFTTLYHGGPKALARSLAAIQEASAQILNELVPEQQSPSEPVTTTSAPQRAYQLDAERFGQIHSAYRDRLIQSMTGFVRDRGKAEDIAARAFERAWQKRENFRGDASPYTYVQAIARNQALKSIQRDQRVRFEPIDAAEVSGLGQAEVVTDELKNKKTGSD
jgi:hypothetical protein